VRAPRIANSSSSAFSTPRANSSSKPGRSLNTSRPGGVLRFVFRGPDGKDYPFDGAYVEIVEHERIVFRGNIHDVPGQDVLTTVTFADHEGKTKLTVHQIYAFKSEATRGASMGWSQTLDHLAKYVAEI
jgi:uncharacterized protein YndB with AHSA1/START domain